MVTDAYSYTRGSIRIFITLTSYWTLTKTNLIQKTIITIKAAAKVLVAIIMLITRKSINNSKKINA